MATQKEEKEDYFKAAELYEKAFYSGFNEPQTTTKKIEILGRLSNIYLVQLKNPKQAIVWLDKIKLEATDSKDLIKSITSSLRIRIDYLGDFELAAKDARSLLNFELTISEYCHVIYDLSFALYQMRKFTEAASEIKECLGNIPIDKALQFRLAKLEIDILVAQDKHLIALDRLVHIKSLFAEMDKDQSLSFLEAIIREDYGDFQGAQAVIKQILSKNQYSDRQFLVLRLEKLKQREFQQAGARLQKKRAK